MAFLAHGGGGSNTSRHLMLLKLEISTGWYNAESARLPPMQPRSDSAPVSCELSLFLVLTLFQGFFSGFSHFPTSTKTNIPNTNLTKWPTWKLAKADVASYLNVVLYLFVCLFTCLSLTHCHKAKSVYCCPVFTLVQYPASKFACQCYVPTIKTYPPPTLWQSLSDSLTQCLFSFAKNLLFTITKS